MNPAKKEKACLGFSSLGYWTFLVGYWIFKLFECQNKTRLFRQKYNHEFRRRGVFIFAVLSVGVFLRDPTEGSQTITGADIHDQRIMFFAEGGR